MKFQEMSYEELQEDFKKILDKLTPEELLESLEKYKLK